MPELTFLGALMVGFLGSTHCLGMCGGIAAATGFNRGGIGRLFSYNIGRLTTYTSIGAVSGLIGAQIVHSVPSLTLVLRFAAGLLIIAMGLYVSRWWMGLARLEQVGALLWRRIQPLTRSLLPVQHHWQALVLGCAWGFLPCGLVYSTLSWSLAAADWQRSALIMLAFGIGTTPAMIGVGVVNQSLLSQARRSVLGKLGGLLIIGMGVSMIATAAQHLSHRMSASAHESDPVMSSEGHRH